MARDRLEAFFSMGVMDVLLIFFGSWRRASPLGSERACKMGPA